MGDQLDYLGKVKINQAPTSLSFTYSVPPHASTKFRHIVSPKPVP